MDSSSYIPKWLIISFIVLTSVLLAFVFIPIINSFDMVFIHHIFNPLKLEYAQRYYGILANISSMLFAICGVFLGYSYFKFGLNHANSNIIRERRRERLREILNGLQRCDSCVCKVLNHEFDNPSDLAKKRLAIIQAFWDLEILIETYEKLQLSDKEIGYLTDVYSFIDTNKIIMENKNPSKLELAQETEKYLLKLQTAKALCYMHIE